MKELPYLSRAEEARSKAIGLLVQLCYDVEGAKGAGDLPSLQGLLHAVSNEIHKMAIQQYAAEVADLHIKDQGT